MSYDLYCYRSQIGRPDADEAERVINAETESESPTLEEWDRMNSVANALVLHDPHLEIFQFDFQKIAELQSISIEEAKSSIDYIELNTPEDDEHYVQFNVLKDHVSMSFGFRMSEGFLERIMAYVEVISKETGYFLYDPQDGSVSDPLGSKPGSSDEILGRESKDSQSNPWWKFW